MKDKTSGKQAGDNQFVAQSRSAEAAKSRAHLLSMISRTRTQTATATASKSG